ncbi:MAG: peptide chain release factor N(5)-glutamine methyltransferase [Reyranellaceae bacterium]
MPTVGEMVASVAARLAAAGIENGRLDARLLVGDATGLTAEAMIAAPEAAIEDPGMVARVERLTKRRLAREPMSQILGRREFWSLSFKVTPDVLTPRPDSETLVETVLSIVPDRSARLRLLDLGVGSGCLLLSLLHSLPSARGLGVDRSERALTVARANAAALGLADRAEMRAGDWGADLPDQYDIVVSNPPYIPSDDIEGLEPEVSEHEPWLALDGGRDGLDAYRTLAGELPFLVREGGWAALEVGQGQAPDVARLMRAAGFRIERVAPDLAGIERVILARRP